jgi:Trk-type K+ transport system membrane component
VLVVCFHMISACLNQRAPGQLRVTLSWAGMAAFATLPLLSSLHRLPFTDAYFETMSGLSTTGATVLTGIDHLPAAINLWRHELNWLGGMGIIVLAVAILPLLGVGGRQLCKAETPGPMKDAQLTPRIAEPLATSGSSMLAPRLPAFLPCASQGCRGSTPSTMPLQRWRSEGSRPMTPVWDSLTPR